MKISGWECIVGAYGSRAASHPENGTITWLQGRIIGSCDAPPEVIMWLIRSALHRAYRVGFERGENYEREQSERFNPYDGEPPNKDSDPS